jgi:predicted acetyltransferase
MEQAHEPAAVARLVASSDPVPEGLEDVLKELGTGDSRFKGTSLGRGEGDLQSFLRECDDAESGRNLPPNRVPQSTYWLVNAQNEVVGMVRVRHHLNERLL